MANRPKGYGLTAELEAKKAKQYSTELEQQARLWMEAVVGEPVNKDSSKLGATEFHLALKDGTYLCSLMNKIQPDSVKRINTSKMAFKMMENIGNFLEAMSKYGVPKSDQFMVVDLYEQNNMTQVVNGLFALARKAQAKGFDGPVLGPKESVENRREFSDDTLRAGEGVIGLQMGTNKGASQAGMNFGKTRHIVD